VLSSPLSIRAGAGGGGALKLADHQHHPLRLKQGVLEWGSMKKQAQEGRMARDGGEVEGGFAGAMRARMGEEAVMWRMTATVAVEWSTWRHK